MNTSTKQCHLSFFGFLEVEEVFSARRLRVVKAGEECVAAGRDGWRKFLTTWLKDTEEREVPTDSEKGSESFEEVCGETRAAAPFRESWEEALRNKEGESSRGVDSSSTGVKTTSLDCSKTVIIPPSD